MMYTIHSWCDALFETWRMATPTDFLPVAIGLVVVAWYARRLSER